MYESYQKKKKPRKRRRRGWKGLFIALFALLLLLALLVLGLLYLPAGLFALEPETDLYLATDLPASPINILLMGVDAENDGLRRSDSMMIASIGPNGLRLVSLLRDTQVEVPGLGQARLNAAYAFGGAELAMQTVNQNFGLNIMHYAVADYTALVKLVDALGGIEVDISDAEMEQINVNVRSMARLFRSLGYTYTRLTISGEQTHLNGLQALGYARIRNLDSDFMRASRQRTVLEAMLKKAKSSNPVALFRAARAALEALETDLSPVQLASLALKAVFASDFKALRVPVNESFEDTGSVLRLTDPDANRAALREFLYGE